MHRPIHGKSSRTTATLAAVLIGTVLGYACSEAARTEGPLVLMPAAHAGQPKTSKLHLPKASPNATKQQQVQRFGQVIGLKRDKQVIYDMLHAHPWEPINNMIKECHIQRYSIYETELDGELYLFAYFEYTGDDFEGDMAKMAKNKHIQEWWKLTDPCQIRLPGTPKGQQWKEIREVYHLD